MSTKVYIGVREDGSRFRPSTWPDMLVGIACIVNRGGRLKYSPYLYTVIINGQKGICIDDRLKLVNRAAYDQAMYFVTTNKLKLQDKT